MFLRTSGKRAETSLPKVMDMIVFCMASFLESHQPGRVQSLHESTPFVCILRTGCEAISMNFGAAAAKHTPGLL